MEKQSHYERDSRNQISDELSDHIMAETKGDMVIMLVYHRDKGVSGMVKTQGGEDDGVTPDEVMDIVGAMSQMARGLVEDAGYSMEDLHD